MKCTQINQTVQKALQAALASHPPMKKIVKAISDSGARVLLVGGAVRDMLLGLPIKDLDCEVHGISMSDLEKILRTFGGVSVVGKSFGVLRLHDLDVDWSLPRSDSSGRKPDVEIDPFMDMHQAFARRDLTMNAMGIDLVTYELLDPFNGQRDMETKTLRTPDPQFFVEDPLRFYRVMQFVARFDMQPDAQLNDICARMDVSGVSIERIEQEFNKMWLRSWRPSLGLRWLHLIHRMRDVLPELAATIGIDQNPKYHPEGDVFEHTMQSIDAAAALSYDSNKAKMIMLYAAMCHDLGKVMCTIETDEGLRALGHEVEGVAPTIALLKRITRNTEMIATVVKLVRYHLLPGQFVQDGAKAPAYKRLARKLAPDVTLQDLAQLALADKRGRNPHSYQPLTDDMPDIDAFLQAAQHADVLESPEEPILHGRDIMDRVEPGARMGELLKRAYEIQIEEGITDKEILKKRVFDIQ